MKALLIAVASALLVGCASITMDENQLIKVDAVTQAGQVVEGANCALRNSRFDADVKSGSSARVRRSSDDLSIKCKAIGLPDADGTAISRANAGLAGNILFGGGIGAIIDHNSGKAYSYPTWMQLIFGESRVFDRNKDKDGLLNLGVVAGSVETPGQAPVAQVAPVVPAPIPAPVVTTTPMPVQVAMPVVQPANVVPSPLIGKSTTNVNRSAKLEDSSALPYVGTRAKQGYAEWLTKPYPRAFALSDRGHWAAAWGDNPADSAQAKDPAARALAVCSGQSGIKCKLYAVDGQIVW